LAGSLPFSGRSTSVRASLRLSRGFLRHAYSPEHLRTTFTDALISASSILVLLQNPGACRRPCHRSRAVSAWLSGPSVPGVRSGLQLRFVRAPLDVSADGLLQVPLVHLDPEAGVPRATFCFFSPVSVSVSGSSSGDFRGLRDGPVPRACWPGSGSVLEPFRVTPSLPGSPGGSAGFSRSLSLGSSSV
jgi:hypothetical protein